MHETPFQVLGRAQITLEGSEYVVGVGDPIAQLPSGNTASRTP
ncbi:hypothetical protein [Tessaracoccus flavus]|nr:hypothetical protein [Tessaracoccus flavus]